MKDFEVDDRGIYSYERLGPEEEQFYKTFKLIMDRDAFINACNKWIIPNLRVYGNKVYLADYKDLKEELDEED